MMTTATTTTTGVQLDRRALLAALERIGRVISKRASKPSLTGVRLEATDGELHLASTDLDVTITATVPCEGRLPATVVVCNNLCKRLKLGKDADCMIVYDEERDALIINGGRVEHVLPTMQPEEFPPCESNPIGQKLVVRSEELVPALKTCLVATAKKPPRYALDSILLESDTKGVRLVAADGWRLVEYTLESVEGDLCGQVLIPHRLAVLLIKVADTKHDEAVVFCVDPQVDTKGERQPARLCVCGHDWRLTADETEGIFPKYRDVIPKSGSKFAVDRRLFIELLSEVSLATGLECKSVRLDLSADAVRVSGQSAQNGESTGCIPAGFAGGGDDRIVVGFNPRLLRDALQFLSGDEVVIDLQQNTQCPTTNRVICKPALLRAEGSARIRWVIMAVNLGLSPSPETLGSNFIEEAT